MTTTHTTPEKVDTLFGESVDFVSYCKANGYRTPKTHKEKDTRPEIEKQDIYTVSDDEVTEMVCARSHGHARSIYLDIIGESWDFTGIKLSIKKHSILKSVVTENILGGIVDSYDDDTIKKLYDAGAYLVQWTGDEYDTDEDRKLSLSDVLQRNYDDECVYWSIPKSKRVCKKNNKQNKSKTSEK